MDLALFSFFCFHFYSFFCGTKIAERCDSLPGLAGLEGRLVDGCACSGTMATTGSDVTAGSHKHELDAHFYGLLMWHLKTRLGILSELYPFSRKGYTSKCLAWLGIRGEIATHRHNRRNAWMFVWRREARISNSLPLVECVGRTLYSRYI